MSVERMTQQALSGIKSSTSINIPEANERRVQRRGYKIFALRALIFIRVYLVRGAFEYRWRVFEEGRRSVAEVARQWPAGNKLSMGKKEEQRQQEAATAASYGFALNMKYCYPRPEDTHAHASIALHAHGR